MTRRSARPAGMPYLAALAMAAGVSAAVVAQQPAHAQAQSPAVHVAQTQSPAVHVAKPPSPDGPAHAADSLTARYFDAIRDDPLRTVMFLREMPKGGDLHSHLSGAVYAESYIEWAAESGMCIDTATLAVVPPPCAATAGRPPASAALDNADLHRRVVDAMSMRNWTAAERSGHAQFFGSFGRFGAGPSRRPVMLAEAAARAAANRVSYLELMVTLDDGSAGRMAAAAGWNDDIDGLRQRLLAAGLRDTAAAALRRLDEHESLMRDALDCATPRRDAGCDVEIRYLYQVGRARPPAPVFGQILMGFEMAALDDRVVGLNLVQPEDDHLALRDYSLHMRMIGELRRHYPDVRVTLHAGELAPGLVRPERLRFHIREAIEVAGASRIGHGVAIAYEDDAHGLLREMARRGILVEIALGSNDAILGVRGRHHPLRLYLDYGVPVTLVTDDEAVLRSELTLQYAKAVADHALRYPELKAMARNAIVYSFADDATKQRLLARLDADFAAFERTWSERATWTGR